MIKILHLLSTNSFSGAENVVCQIMLMMKNESNIEMVYSSCDGPIRDAILERNLIFEPIKKLTVFEIKKIIKKLNPDIIHAHDMRASFVASLACGKIPLITHIHNNNYNSRKLTIKSIAYFYAAIKSKHIFWVSKSSFDGYYFHSYLVKKSSVLSNIINIDKIYEKMNQDIRTYDYDIIYVGRLTFEKNPQRMISVIEEVIRLKPDIKTAIVGTGDLEEEIKKMVNIKKLNNNIYFLGFQNNPYKIIHDSKVMIMTSRWEGTPMCALESLALGTPIVSTPTDGLCDLIENGKNGNLANTNILLINSIIDIINNTKKREEMSEYSYKKAIEYNDVLKYKQKVKLVYSKLKSEKNHE